MIYIYIVMPQKFPWLYEILMINSCFVRLQYVQIDKVQSELIYDLIISRWRSVNLSLTMKLFLLLGI